MKYRKSLPKKKKKKKEESRFTYSRQIFFASTLPVSPSLPSQ